MENDNFIQQNSQPVSIGDWLVTYLILVIPIAGFIMLFVWAFSSDTKPSKANWAKANLILMGIVFGIYFMIFLVFGGYLLESLKDLNY